jgi:hypothetical protein
MIISRIQSGFQSGADIGGINAAIDLLFPYGGWVPKGRKYENGRIPDYYIVKESSSSRYEPRTELNVQDSDVTLVFTRGEPSTGSKLTIEYAKVHNKPCLHIDLLRYGKEDAIKQIQEFLTDIDKQDLIVNVAGQRESKAKGIQMEVRAIITEVLKWNNG